MNSREIARRFAATWQTGWATHDVDLLLSLYAPGIVHRSMPFREPHQGISALREYLTWSFSEENVRSVEFGEPLVDGDTAAIEFRVSARGRRPGRMCFRAVRRERSGRRDPRLLAYDG